MKISAELKIACPKCGGTPLPAQAAQWPTPVAQNIKGSSLADTGGLHVVTLPEWLAMERGLV